MYKYWLTPFMNITEASAKYISKKEIHENFINSFNKISINKNNSIFSPQNTDNLDTKFVGINNFILITLHQIHKLNRLHENMQSLFYL
jgi:hypothetical protein